VYEAKREQEWANFLTRIKESFLLESPLFLKEASIRKNPYPFKAIFILGPAGSGKSFLSGDDAKLGGRGLDIPKAFKVANPDERIESVFPAFGISMKFVGKALAKTSSALEKEMDIQQTSRKIMQNATSGHTANLLMIANPVVFDTTGEEPKKIIPRIDNLIRLGYDVGVFQVNVPTSVSVDRDKKRDRTVGELTGTISATYQKEVVQNKAYMNHAASQKNMTIFGKEIYPNLFNLETHEMLPGITQELVDEIAPGFDGEKAEAILAQAKTDVQKFLSPEPNNEDGKKILAAMKKMVDLTGRYGQNMNDLSFTGKVAEEFPKVVGDPTIKIGVDYIASLAGVSGTIKNAVLGFDAEGQPFRDEAGEKVTGPMQTMKQPSNPQGDENTPQQGLRKISGSEIGNRDKQFAVKQKQEIDAVRADDSLSDKDKKKAIEKIANRKKFEERLSKTAIYNIVKNAIDN
jgi:hypothetical protein